MTEKELRKVVVNNIHAAMERARIPSVNILARRAKVGQSALSRVMRLEGCMTTDRLASVAKALGVQPWELLVDDQATREEAMKRMLGK